MGSELNLSKINDGSADLAPQRLQLGPKADAQILGRELHRSLYSRFAFGPGAHALTATMELVALQQVCTLPRDANSAFR